MSRAKTKGKPSRGETFRRCVHIGNDYAGDVSVWRVTKQEADPGVKWLIVCWACNHRAQSGTGFRPSFRRAVERIGEVDQGGPR